ncbi:RHS repeat domain-containing protein [Cysteiniphilum halobium]|uniref:RHS repeat domain-containing protein n=1 Tax=Cysteiniphilum halobium TaxID=2219059 RepID=UPI000E64628F|nr:RHS repeat-associated core domain-containing protein [Cysteiniphilum halobium]
MLNNKSKLCIGMGMSCLLITQSMAYSLDSVKSMDKQSNQNVNHQRVLVSSALHYNANGNMSTDNQGASFSYNAANALTQVSLASGAKESDYYYANGLRAVAQSNTQVLVHYYSRHNQLLNSSDGAQQSSAYLIANNVAVRSVNGDATVLLHNRHGSVIAQFGDMPQFYQYDVYGVRKTEDGVQRTENGSGSLDLAINPLRYSGYMFDPLTGLYYLKARDYDPYLRSFIQVDSYAFNNYGLINGYYYSNNNPVMGIDPSGHAPLPDIDWDEVQQFLQGKSKEWIEKEGEHLGGGVYGNAYRVTLPEKGQDFVIKIYYPKRLEEKKRYLQEFGDSPTESPAQRDARVLNKINVKLNGDDKFASTIRLSDGNDYLLSKYVKDASEQLEVKDLREIALEQTDYAIYDRTADNIKLVSDGIGFVPYVLDVDQAVAKPNPMRPSSPISKVWRNVFSNPDNKAIIANSQPDFLEKIDIQTLYSVPETNLLTPQENKDKTISYDLSDEEEI